jgi:hypothetical protein
MKAFEKYDNMYLLNLTVWMKNKMNRRDYIIENIKYVVFSE